MNYCLYSIVGSTLYLINAVEKALTAVVGNVHKYLHEGRNVLHNLDSWAVGTVFGKACNRSSEIVFWANILERSNDMHN